MDCLLLRYLPIKDLRHGIDLNRKIISTINKGKIHIVERDLAKYVKSAILKSKLKAFSKIQKSDVYLICVPTPLNKEKNKSTLSAM